MSKLLAMKGASSLSVFIFALFPLLLVAQAHASSTRGHSAIITNNENVSALDAAFPIPVVKARRDLQGVQDFVPLGCNQGHITIDLDRVLPREGRFLEVVDRWTSSPSGRPCVRAMAGWQISGF